jgi:hypothetical protein
MKPTSEWGPSDPLMKDSWLEKKKEMLKAHSKYQNGIKDNYHELIITSVFLLPYNNDGINNIYCFKG